MSWCEKNPRLIRGSLCYWQLISSLTSHKLSSGGEKRKWKYYMKRSYSKKKLYYKSEKQTSEVYSSIKRNIILFPLAYAKFQRTSYTKTAKCIYIQSFLWHNPENTFSKRKLKIFQRLSPSLRRRKTPRLNKKIYSILLEGNYFYEYRATSWIHS